MQATLTCFIFGALLVECMQRPAQDPFALTAAAAAATGLWNAGNHWLSSCPSLVSTSLSIPTYVHHFTSLYSFT